MNDVIYFLLAVGAVGCSGQHWVKMRSYILHICEVSDIGLYEAGSCLGLPGL